MSKIEEKCNGCGKYIFDCECRRVDTSLTPKDDVINTPVCNYYGNVFLFRSAEKFYMALGNHDTDHGVEIPGFLFDAAKAAFDK